MYTLLITIGVLTQQFPITWFVYDPAHATFAYTTANPHAPVLCRDVDAFTFAGNQVSITAGSCSPDTVFANGFEVRP